MENTPRVESWREALKFMGTCPICQAKYDSADAKLFAKQNNANLVHITCSACGSYFIALVMVLGQGISTVGMVTDLNFDDARRIHNLEPLTADDIIDGYQTIKQQNFINNFSSKTV